MAEPTCAARSGSSSKKIRKLPVLAALGVRRDGRKEVLALELLVKESAGAWREVLGGLVRRGLNRPLLAVIDGHPGLRSALEEVWRGIAVQRGTVHKLRNLQDHCPEEAYRLVEEDYHRIVEAKGSAEAREAYKAFAREWEKEPPQATKSLQEAGEELLTFYAFPSEPWKFLKTTNLIERLDLEFKRRVKTPCSHPSEKSAILILYGLLLSGRICFRGIDGWRTIVQVVSEGREELKKRAS